MTTTPISHANLISRQQYAEQIQLLRSQHSCIPPDAEIDPAPGRLAATRVLLKQMSRILQGRAVDFFQICENQETHHPVAFIDTAAGLPDGRRRALDKAFKEFSTAAMLACRVCGARLDDNVRGFFGNVRSYCEGHQDCEASGAVFLEDVQALSAQPAKKDSEAAPALPDDEFDHDDGLDDGLIGKGPQVELFAEDSIDLLDQDARGRDKDTRSRLTEIIKSLRTRDRFRDLATLPQDWRERLNKLEDEFPNFPEFIGILRCQFALAELGAREIKLPPTLLNGPPGIGKTEILMRLAAVLDMPPPLVIDFSTAQNSSALTGTDAHWSNAREGELFRTLALGPIANPIVYLDEIEKAGGEGRYNPLAALHGLLEKSTAKAYVDLSLRTFTIDASYVNWVTASNNAEYLDPPILSRLTRIDVAAPTPAQARAIQRNIFQRMRETEPWGVFFEALPESTLDALTGIVPRQAKNLLRLGAGKAVEEGRHVILPEDFRSYIPRRRQAANFVAEVSQM